MTIPIYSDKNLHTNNASSSLKKETSTVSKINNISEVKATSQNTTSPENNGIQISAEAKILNTYLNETANESIDWNKVNQIKDKINAGIYTINPQQIAEKILDLDNKLD